MSHLRSFYAYAVSIGIFLLWLYIVRIWALGQVASVITFQRPSPSALWQALIFKDMVGALGIYFLVFNVVFTFLYFRTGSVIYPSALLAVCGALFGLMLLLSAAKPADYFSGAQLDLVKAAMSGNEAQLKKAVSEGAEFNAIGNEFSRRTPLTYAVERRDIAAVKLLIKNGAAPEYQPENAPGAPALAARQDSTEVLAALLDSGADVHWKCGGAGLGFSAADFAATGKIKPHTYKTLELLFARGLPVDDRNGDGDTLLIDAVSRGEFSFAEWLIGKGANVHAVNCTLNSVANNLQYGLDGHTLFPEQAQKFKKLLESRGIQFPVPTSKELQKKLGDRFPTREEASGMDENGEMSFSGKNNANH